MSATRGSLSLSPAFLLACGSPAAVRAFGREPVSRKGAEEGEFHDAAAR